jgi:hypothetical protein
MSIQINLANCLAVIGLFTWLIIRACIRAKGLPKKE